MIVSCLWPGLKHAGHKDWRILSRQILGFFWAAPARLLSLVLRLKLFLKSRSIKIALVGDNLISLKPNDGSSFD